MRCYSELRSTTDAEVLVCTRLVVEQFDDGVVGLREVRRAEEIRPPKSDMLACPLHCRAVLRPSVPATPEVLRSKVRNAVLTLLGMSVRAAAVPMASLGVARFMAARKSAELALAIALRSTEKPRLPIAALVPLRSRSRRTKSPKTAMISDSTESKRETLCVKRQIWIWTYRQNAI